jgi:hypothetical protein
MKSLVNLLKLGCYIIAKAVVFEYEPIEEVAVRDGMDILLG